MRTYFWISLFMSYRITANQLIQSNVILIANKGFRKKDEKKKEKQKKEKPEKEKTKKELVFDFRSYFYIVTHL
jgi:hypothetical protein